MKRLMRGLVTVSVLSGSAFAGEVTKTPVTKAPPAQVEVKKDEVKKTDERPVLDVVFVLDTTGSMGGLLEGAKQKIWSIASRMASGTPTPRVRVGLVAYRDQGDAYVTQDFQLTEDLDTVYKNLKSFQPDGGGDGPEAVQDGLRDAVEKMQWSANPHAAKMIFVVGDAPAHDQDRAKLVAESKLAISKGIVVNTIRCGGDGVAETQFREMARLADGRFDTIDQGGGVVAVATPYDDELSKLNSALADTAIYAGRREVQAEGERKRAESKAMAAPAAADRVGFLSKSAKGKSMAEAEDAVSGAGAIGAVDLTAAPEKAATMKDEDLPAPMQKLSKEERVAWAKKNQAERQALNDKIQALTQKRDDFLRTKVAEKTDSFDNRVFESVKASAKKAGVAY